jgi:hypothetical protein
MLHKMYAHAIDHRVGRSNFMFGILDALFHWPGFSTEHGQERHCERMRAFTGAAKIGTTRLPGLS